MADHGTVLQIASMVPPARYGGAERVVEAFAGELGAAGWRVENRGLRKRGRSDEPGTPIRNIYWPFDGDAPGAAARAAWHAIDTYTLSSAGVVGRLIDETAPDVIVTHSLRGWGYAPWTVAARRGIQLVHVIHDYGLLCNSSTLWHDGASCAGRTTHCRARVRSTMKRWPGGQLVGVSKAVLAQHHQLGFGDPDQCEVVYPLAAAHSPAVTTRVSDPETSTVFGYLGRVSPEKGIATLVDAVSGTGKQLVVAGDGEPAELAALQRRSSGEVAWRGWIDPAELFASIDVLVVPSMWLEPFGLVVVEAARAGLPVLLADQPGLVEAAQASGARYLTYPADDVAALRQSLDIPVSDYRRGSVQAGETKIADVVARARDVGRVTPGA